MVLLLLEFALKRPRRRVVSLKQSYVVLQQPPTELRSPSGGIFSWLRRRKGCANRRQFTQPLDACQEQRAGLQKQGFRGFCLPVAILHLTIPTTYSIVASLHPQQPCR
jgi:hypothetical protein